MSAISRVNGRARVVVVGTGTGVGKTHVACALLAGWRARGVSAVGLKPIESGVGMVATDASRLAEASGVFHVKQVYAFAEPVSPHLAARKIGVRIDIDAVAAWVDAHQGDVTVVETAGGLFSPLGNGLTNCELTRRLVPDLVVLCGVDRLGVLHDVTACLRAAPDLVREAFLVLRSPEDADASTGTNCDELRQLGIVERVLVVPQLAPQALTASLEPVLDCFT